MKSIIAISCPGFCMTPFSAMAEMISPHFDSWEIVAEGKHAMPDIADEIKDCKASYNFKFTVHAPFSDLNIASLNPRIRESTIAQIEETLRISSDLDIRLITIHPGHKSPLGVYFLDKIKIVHKESLNKIDKLGEEYGVVLALENIPKMWISLCSYAKEITELTQGTSMKICFDVGHANISDDIPNFLGLKQDFANVHLHDNQGKIDRHLVLGQGNIDLKSILEELKEYKGDFVIESMDLKQGVQSKAILEKMLRDI